MIAGLRGVVDDVGPDFLLVNVGGVVYQAFAPTSTLSAVDGPGEPIELRTYLQVRDDALTLFGFATREELRMFQLLISVTSVGPRIALSLLSAMPADSVAAAIASEDMARLSSVTGVGKRTAARIVLELKGKVGQVEPGAGSPAASATVSQLIAALTSLGYSSAEATVAVKAVPNLAGMDLEEGLREVLRALVVQR